MIAIASWRITAIANARPNTCNAATPAAEAPNVHGIIAIRYTI
jgi:hypothetical protein